MSWTVTSARLSQPGAAGETQDECTNVSVAQIPENQTKGKGNFLEMSKSITAWLIFSKQQKEHECLKLGRRFLQMSLHIFTRQRCNVTSRDTYLAERQRKEQQGMDGPQLFFIEAALIFHRQHRDFKETSVREGAHPSEASFTQKSVTPDGEIIIKSSFLQRGRHEKGLRENTCLLNRKSINVSIQHWVHFERSKDPETVWKIHVW